MSYTYANFRAAAAALLLSYACALATPLHSAPPRVLRGRYVSVQIAPVVCNVMDFGAKGDGKTDDTSAIQGALDHCGKAGGGTVKIPAPKTFLIFSIHFTSSNQELNIETGATLLGSDDIKAWDGGKVGSALIVAPKAKNGLQHIAITGGGTVNGQGLLFWRGRAKNVFRPHTVDFGHVAHAIISGITFTQNPNHVLELGCDFCELSHISVLNPPSTGACEKDLTCSHNTDAVDVHGSPFYIHNVNFSTGDDNVAVHANDTLVEDSYFGTGHGASIGSMCDESIRNFTVRRMTFKGTTSALRIKAHTGCHGHVWDILYEDIVMEDVQQPIVLQQDYSVTDSSGVRALGVGPPSPPPSPPKPPSSSVSFESITYRNITSTGGGDKHGTVVSLLCGTKLNGGINCEKITFDGVSFEGLGKDGTKTGMVCSGVQGTALGLSGINNCMAKKQPMVAQ